MLIRVVQTVELTQDEVVAVCQYAEELGLSIPFQKSRQESQRLLVAKLLKLYGQDAIDAVRGRMTKT
jgi:hypothetical protein